MSDDIRTEVAECAFEYLLAEVLAMQPPEIPEDEHVYIFSSLFVLCIIDFNTWLGCAKFIATETR